MRPKPKPKRTGIPEPVKRLGPAVALVAMVLIAFHPALSAGFIWDDPHHVEENVSLRSARGLVDIWLWPITHDWRSPATPQYYPVTFTSFWLEYRFWDGSPQGYHWTNVLLHGLNAILVWRVLLMLQVPGAWLAAAVFAVHPVHVESVAWISERKNLLSTFFYGLAMLAMLRFYAPGTPGKLGRRWLYAFGIVCFIGALLSKTVTCSFPAALLLILWWKRGVLWRSDILVPLIPFFAIAPLSLLTPFIEQESIGAYGEPWEISFIERVLIAGRALWFYASKLLFPANLTFFYPRWEIGAWAWWQYLYPAAALAVIAGLWLARQRIGKGPLVGMLFFAGTLFPALGFFNYFPMLFSFVADHFQYLASVGLIALGCAGLALVLKRVGPAGNLLTPILAGGLLAVFTLLTMGQSYVYTSVDFLYEDVIEKNPNSWIAHYNLGIEMMKDERFGRKPKYETAEQHLRQTLELYPELERHMPEYAAAVHHNLGNVAIFKRRYDEAFEHHLKASKIAPKQAAPHFNLGMTRVYQQRFEEAAEHFARAVELEPNYGMARLELGRNLLALKEAEEAIGHLSKAAALMPEHAEAYYLLGEAFNREWKPDESIKNFRKAIELAPSNADYHFALSSVLREYVRQGADYHLREAARLNPQKYAEMLK